MLAKNIAPHATTTSECVNEFVYKLKVAAVGVQVLLLSARPNDGRLQLGTNDGGTPYRYGFLSGFSVVGAKWNRRGRGGEKGGQCTESLGIFTCEGRGRRRTFIVLG